jgi:hypothetical protein
MLKLCLGKGYRQMAHSANRMAASANSTKYTEVCSYSAGTSSSSVGILGRQGIHWPVQPAAVQQCKAGQQGQCHRQVQKGLAQCNYIAVGVQVNANTRLQVAVKLRATRCQGFVMTDPGRFHVAIVIGAAAIGLQEGHAIGEWRHIFVELVPGNQCLQVSILRVARVSIFDIPQVRDYRHKNTAKLL